MKDQRKNWLASLIGNGAADDIEKAATGGGAALDARGVARKQDDVAAGDPAATPDDTLFAVAVAILDALKAAGATVPDEGAAAEAIKAVLVSATAGADAEDEAIPVSDGGMVKALTDALITQTKDVGTIAEQQMALAKAITAIAPQMETVLTRLNLVEAQVKARPRIASQDDSTIIQGEDVAKAIKVGLNGEKKMVLNIPVKD